MSDGLSQIQCEGLQQYGTMRCIAGVLHYSRRESYNNPYISVESGYLSLNVMNVIVKY